MPLNSIPESQSNQDASGLTKDLFRSRFLGTFNVTQKILEEIMQWPEKMADLSPVGRETEIVSLPLIPIC